tara:strand:- start:133 stop:474 length:342 start_codon:yes stop_codon:yes gene_type:complete
MTFFQAINICFNKYTVFSGRAQRSEYWYWRLFELFLALVAFRLDSFFLKESELGSFSLFVFFFTCIPGIAVSIRRLHDVNKSGWWLLISLTGIGNLLLLYWFLLPSDDNNIYN